MSRIKQEITVTLGNNDSWFNKELDKRERAKSDGHTGDSDSDASSSAVIIDFNTKERLSE